MGSAIAKCSGRIYPTIGFDVDKRKCDKSRWLVKIAKDNRNLVSRGDVIILAIKPHEMGAVLEEIRDLLTKDKLIISIAAGISTRYIEKIVGKIPVVRVMPNIAILVKESASAICRGKYAKPSDEKIALKIFAEMGKVFKVLEEFMNAVTALSGSGPAYFFEIINSFIKAGIKLGLPKNMAKNLVFQTARGVVNMLEQVDNDPVALREMVTSKKGTTIEGLKILWKNHLEDILIKAVSAANRRAVELAKLLEKRLTS